MFPTWSEVLEVLRDLGYEKTDGHRARPRPSAGRRPAAWPPAEVAPARAGRSAASAVDSRRRNRLS